MPASDEPGMAGERSAYARTERVRMYRRAQGDGLGFVPWGLIPAIGLALVLFTGLGSFARSIEDTTRETARRALTDSGADWATPDVSGQWVLLEGTPPTPDAQDRAIAAVRQARTSTWLGAARPATRVRAVSSTVAPGTAAPAVTSASEPNDRYEWTYRLAGKAVTLQGRVPNDTTRALIADAAGAAFLPPQSKEIVNQLVVDPGEAPDGFSNIALRGITAISKCEDGLASFAKSVLAVRCSLPASEKAALEALVRAPLPYGRIGDIELLEAEAVVSCDAALSSLLDAARIEFDSGSAVLSASSAAILDRVASTARECPGTLRIEGHTDSTGTVRENLALSLARGEAVRAGLIARGLADERLTANGYGAGRPRDTNATAEGRARNRRIEIRVAPPSDD